MPGKSLIFLLHFIFSILFTAAPMNAPAQENILKIDLFGVLNGVERFTYERFIIPKLSALINFENGIYHGKRTVLQGNTLGEIFNLKGYGIMPELRFYPVSNGSFYDGIFVGAHYRYRWISENFYINIDPVFPDPNAVPFVTTKGTLQDYGANLGYRHKWHFFVFEALAGFGISKGELQSPNNRNLIYSRIKKADFQDNKFAARMQLSIGFSFPNFNKQDYLQRKIKNTRTL